MKKLILLALVALVAGAAFAETAPAFSGDFEYRTQMDFANEEYAVDDTEGAAAINLNGVVDEWSTVNAELSADSGLAVTLNQFTLTTDVTGALGADGPVGFTLTWGALTREAAEYNDVAGYSDKSFSAETGTYLGAELLIAIGEKVNIIALVAPSTYIGGTWTISRNAVTTPANLDAVLGFEVQFLGLVDGLDFNAWYTKDTNAGAGIDQLGVSAGYTSDMINAGFIFGGDLDADQFGMGISFQYLMDVLTLGAAFGVADFSAFDAANVGLNITWMAVPDMLDIFVAVNIPFSNFDTAFGVDAGLNFYLGATTYVLGYDYQNAGFEGPELTTDGGMYLKVKASF